MVSTAKQRLYCNMEYARCAPGVNIILVGRNDMQGSSLQGQPCASKELQAEPQALWTHSYHTPSS
jgi:hypothetical protein